MSENKNHSQHEEPVNFLPTPPKPVREAVLSERRRYGRELAAAALNLKELHNAAYVDTLTGLGNRRVLDEQFPKLFANAKEHNLPIALVAADVRGLKRVNDKDGHAKGDELLKAAGEAFGDILREGDIGVHVSGDEFVAILVGYAPLEGQTLDELDEFTTNRLEGSFEAAAKVRGIPDERHVGIDLAIVMAQADDTPESMLKRGDAAMQANKDAYYARLGEPGKSLQDRRASDSQVA